VERLIKGVQVEMELLLLQILEVVAVVVRIQQE
jgi:hypothetical protein